MALIATTKNVIITFTPYIDPVNSFQFQEFSKVHILEVADVDQVKFLIGNDGIAQASVVVAQVDGSFSFLPTSKTLQNIYILQTAVYLSGIPVQGVLTVKLPSSNIEYLYRDFTILSGPKGVSLQDEAQPVLIKWSSQLAIPTQV